MPIINLVHVTHNAEAHEICMNAEEYKFEARKKLGKVLGAYDGRPCGESFRANQDKSKFTQITDDEPVFPDFYSWWSIYPTVDAVLDGCTSVAQVKVAVDLLHKKRQEMEVTDCLQPEPDSHYGNNAFVCKFQSILNAYAKSRGTRIDKVYMRNGGTLRYTCKICYVIIVCIDEDEERLKHFNPLTPLTMSEQFQTNGLVTVNGQIGNPAAISIFSPNYVIKKLQGLYSYETAAFAFYFPTEDGSLSMSSRNCSKKPVIHKKCTKTQPPQWKCPNDL